MSLIASQKSYQFGSSIVAYHLLLALFKHYISQKGGYISTLYNCLINMYCMTYESPNALQLVARKGHSLLLSTFKTVLVLQCIKIKSKN